MRNSLKIIIFLVVLAILGALAVVGYKTYLSQNQASKLPYATTATPEPDTTQAIEADLNATTLPDLESELKGLDQETSGL